MSLAKKPTPRPHDESVNKESDSGSSAERALAVLGELGRIHRAVSLAEISRRLDIAQPTVARDLAALEKAGFAARHSQSGHYMPGPSAGRLRQAVFDRFPLREVCHPYLSQIAVASGETTTLTVPLGWFGVQIAAVIGTNEVISTPALGRIRFLSDGAPSRAILAFRPEILVSALLRHVGLRYSKQAAHGFTAALEEIRQAGCAVEPSGTAMAVSFPLRLEGRAVGSLSIEGPVVNQADLAWAKSGAGQTLTSSQSLRRCVDAVAEIEATLRGKPMLAANPFDYIPPEDIRLQPSPW
jgi:DNA-binding IclR family transcriptional regulator